MGQGKTGYSHHDKECKNTLYEAERIVALMAWLIATVMVLSGWHVAEMLLAGSTAPTEATAASVEVRKSLILSEI